MPRLTREAWLEAGLRLLKEQGAAALTIDGLTKRLGVTKGSFYHHFRNRNEFSQALLSFWEKRLTHELIEASRDGHDFSERNLLLSELGERLFEPGLEIAIRAWALRNPEVLNFQERVDRQRIDYLVELFQLATQDLDLAQDLALIRYAFYVGAQQMRPSLSSRQYARLLDVLQTALLGNTEKKTKNDGGQQ